MQRTLNINDLKRMLRISDPFLFIDSVDNIVPKKSGIGRKFLKQDEWFFESHFTDQPMMPGTLLEEAMLQTIVATVYSSEKFKNKICLITSSKTNFYSKIDKPTTLIINIKILKITRLKVETSAIIKSHDNIKIASGIYNYFISNR